MSRNTSNLEDARKQLQEKEQHLIFYYFWTKFLLQKNVPIHRNWERSLFVKIHFTEAIDNV